MPNTEVVKEKGVVVDIAKARAAREYCIVSYWKQLEEIRDYLAELKEWCQVSTFNLDMSGPWKEWGDEQPIGAMVEFDEDALRECGDPIVKCILDLCSMAEVLGNEIDELQ